MKFSSEHGQDVTRPVSIGGADAVMPGISAELEGSWPGTSA